MEQKVKELKAESKKKLRSTTDLHEGMSLIDAIQHLGIDYHFEEEIDEALDRLYNSELECFDLHEFKDDKGNFAETLRNDPRGLLSLYNAAYLGTRGENILEEAISFARIHLESIANNLKPPLANQVSRALVTPLSRSVKRLETRYYISDYEMEDERDDTIFELAKLDFNLLQSLHCEELKSISLWWKDLELEDKLCYARDRIVELYFWMLGVYFEPHYSRARMIATKVVSLASILDDTYDVYGTLEECRLLTDAIQRPSKNSRMNLHRKITYLKETEWYAHDYVPTFEERLQTSMVSSTYPALICASFVGMDNIATREAFEWVTSMPEVVKDSAILSRLMNDITSFE
ncbi:Alpha-humulene synthase, partial [Ananas comosus]